MTKRVRIFICSLVLTAPLASFQTVRGAADDLPASKLDANPDTAWSQLRAMSTPAVSVARPGETKKIADIKAEREAKAKGLVDAAGQAKVFYTKFPAHAKAGEAKKLEITNLLDAVHVGEVAEEPRALRLGMKFRNDKANAEADRFQIATRMMHLDVEKKKLRSNEARLEEFERQADNFLAEFPGNADVYRLYLGVVQNAPEAKARQAANKILLAPAPEAIKQQARTVLERHDLIGKSPSLEFVGEGETAFNLEDKRGKVVIAYVWSGANQSSLSTFSTVASAMTAQHEVIGINVEKDVAKARATIAKEKPPGLQYVDARGLGSPAAAQLKVVDVPCVYVFRTDGKLVGFGPVGQLTELLSKAGK